MTIQTNLDDLITALAANGYAVIDQAMPDEAITQLRNEACKLKRMGLMQSASTGKNSSAHILSALRGDFTHWLDTTISKPSSNQIDSMIYIKFMESLRQLLNQTLFLGLFDFETHYAIYPAGTGYSKHLDQFQQNNLMQANISARKISSILYLNQNWKTHDGGQLRLYLEAEHLEAKKNIDIEPISGRLVIFLSDRFWHEVLPAKRERISLTGWFRLR